MRTNELPTACRFATESLRRALGALAPMILASTAVFGTLAHAQTYPSKPVRIIAVTAGTTGDVLARYVGQRANNLLLLHAGAVERDGLALVMPAVPGSGKSTLTAALAMRGWRLLSDEFGAYDPQSASFCPVLKPVALKNRSIEVIRRFAPDAVLGPVFAKTRKGDVAHLASPPQAVAARGRTAAPGAFLLPKWQDGSETRLEPLVENRLFPALAFNAFNYGLLGLVGFHSAVDLVRQCPGWQLVYSDLEEAVAAIAGLWPEVRSHHTERHP